MKKMNKKCFSCKKESEFLVIAPKVRVFYSGGYYEQTTEGRICLRCLEESVKTSINILSP